MDLTLNELKKMEDTLRNAWVDISEDMGTEKELVYYNALHSVRRLCLYLGGIADDCTD